MEEAAGGYDVVDFTKSLCNLTKASTVLFSFGRNKHDNPRAEVVETVLSIIRDARIACTQLSKRCANALPKHPPNHLLSFFARGKGKHECCAGTFIIKLGDQIEHLPERKDHQKIIIGFAPTHLCKPLDI